MRPISGFSSCAARLRICDALAPLLVASPESEPPGSANLSPRGFGPSLAQLRQRLGDPVRQGNRVGSAYVDHLLGDAMLEIGRRQLEQLAELAPVPAEL